MEINPQSIIAPDAPAQGHTIRVDLEWTPTNVPGSIIFYDLACTTPNSSWSEVSSTGSLSFSHTNIGYLSYPIQFRFYPCTLFPYPQEHNIQGTYTIFYDGRFMKTAPFQIQGICGSGGGNAIYNTAFRPPLITNYTFDIVTENYCFGSEGDIFISGNANNCSNTIEIDTSINKTLKLEILDGKDFVSFYQNGVAKDTATVRYDNIDNWNLTLKDITIKQDSFYIGTQPLNVIVKSNWSDEIRYDTVKINPQTATEIYVSSQQPIIVTSGGVSGIQVSSVAGYGICATELPDSVKYKAAIIKGQQLGNLVDYNNGNAGDMLINLDHYNGQRVVGFETEGRILHELDTVIVNIETTDPNINTVQALLIITPNDIDVQIIPETISKGDTARVILKKRNGDILEDFAADKLFNVEIIEGIEYGLILDSLSNDTLTTFENILQGFKIIAKDSTGIDSTKIRIKVTTEETIVLPAARITKEKQKEEIQNKTLSKDDKEGEIIAAWIGDPGAPVLIEGFGDVVVKQDECGNFPCDEIILKPSFTFETHNSGWSNSDPCTEEQIKHPDETVAGIFSVIWNETDVLGYFNRDNFSACYKPATGKWKFGTKIPMYPYFNTIKDICLNNITNKNFQPLENINDIATIWNDPNICAAKKDLEVMRAYYGKTRPQGYVFLEVVLAHETAHGQDFQWVIDSLQNNFLYPALNSLEIICGSNSENGEVNNEYDAISKYYLNLSDVILGKKQGEKIIYYGFEDRLHDGYEAHIKQSFYVNNKKIDHEEYINQFPIVNNTIDVLVNEFESIWNCK